MYANHRTHKEPEINTLVTSSMAPWNTGQLGADSLAKEQEKLLNPTQLAPVDKSQSLKEIVRKYQESQYYNYSVFLGQLGSLGYCTFPIEMPTILEVVPQEYADEMKACKTYAEYKQRNKRSSDNFEFGTENSNKKYKADDGWGDESGEGGKSTNNKPSRPAQSQASWDDEDNNNKNVKRTRSKGDHRKSSNPANRMQTGWSDEENDQQSRNDRFGGNNDRFGDRRGGSNGDRGFRGRGRGRGRGGGQWNDSRTPRYDNNDRFNNANNESAGASGWSDDESKATTKPAADNKITPKIDPIDDWDNPHPIISRESSTDQTLSTIPSTTTKTDDGWDD